LPKAESHFGEDDVIYFWAFRILGVLSGVLPQVAGQRRALMQSRGEQTSSSSII